MPLHKHRNTGALISALALLAIPATASADGGDIQAIDFAAAAPYTYDHKTGGGAYDDRTVGIYDDVVESLQGGDFACGDIVTYLVAVGVDPVPVDANQTVQFDVHLLSQATGQSGAGHVDITYVGVNYGPTSAGDGPGATDSGNIDDGGSTAVLIDEFFAYANNGDPAPGGFIDGVDLIARIQLDDLEAGEQVIVRVDSLLGCQAYTSATGTLQGALTDTLVVAPVVDSFGSGNQTIPFLQIGSIEGTGDPGLALFKTVTTEDGTCPGGELIDAVEGDFVKYCYEVTNPGTADLYDASVTDDNGTPGDLSDDFEVSLIGLADLDGDGFADDLAADSTATGMALVEADLRGGDVLTNIGSAAGNNGASGGQFGALADTDTASVNVAPAPMAPAELTVEVLASPDADCSDDNNVELQAVPEGSTVYYCYYVTNTGEQSVSGITIDSTTATVSGSLDLAPGESGSLLSDPIVATSDSTESATASGLDESGEPVGSEPDTAGVTVVSTGLAIVTTVSLDAICGNDDDAELQTVISGSEVTYCYTVTNTGDDSLTGVTVSDPDATVSGSADLASGESFTFSSDPVLADGDATHLATAAGSDSFGSSVASDPDDAAHAVVSPSLDVQVTASTDGTCPGSEDVTVLTGDSVTWCYAVTNTGDTTIEDVTLVDSDGNVIVIGTLAAGESATATIDESVIEDGAQSAGVSGTEPLTATTVSSVEDFASADVVDPALAIDVTVSLDGLCPGDEVVNVLEGTDVTWCYTVTNTGDVSVSGINVSDETGAVGTIDSLAPGESSTLSLSDVAWDDSLLNGTASGTDDAVGSTVNSDLDPAAVDVVHPGLNLDVTLSEDGLCPGSDSLSVSAGELVDACYTLTNDGDTALYDVAVYDDAGNLVGIIEVLLPGESVTLAGDAFLAETDGPLSGTVEATDEYGFDVADDDTALLDVLFADINVSKTGPEKVITSSTDAISWSVTVTNEGDAIAEEVLMTDTLPEGVNFVSASSSVGSCMFDGMAVECSLGDIAPGAFATITIDGTVTVSLTTLTNVAFADTLTPEDDASDNSDSAVTLVAPGATRTIGFWGRHPDFVAQCLEVNGDFIDLGYTVVANESADDEIDVDLDSDVETAMELAMGVFKANVARFTNRQKRSPLEQARTQAGRQVLGAYCNETLLGGESGIDFDAAAAILAGTDIGAILALSTEADTFNNSGDSVDLGVNPGKANGRYPWDDGTDLND